ncbi:hypothetical protein NMY22_g16620 [Coprinellus aureogranulatus]|nr:hypothetical protein NMY22_g16620 [Coprinellus aureogranulatus]
MAGSGAYGGMGGGREGRQGVAVQTRAAPSPITRVTRFPRPCSAFDPRKEHSPALDGTTSKYWKYTLFSSTTMKKKICRCRPDCNELLSKTQRDRHYRQAEKDGITDLRASLSPKPAHRKKKKQRDTPSSSSDSSSEEDLSSSNSSTEIESNEDKSSSSEQERDPETQEEESRTTSSDSSDASEDESLPGTDNDSSTSSYGASNMGYAEGEEPGAWLVELLEEIRDEALADLQEHYNDILTEQDRNNIRGFKILTTGVSRRSFKQMRHSLRDTMPVNSKDIILRRIAVLTAMKPLYIDCCIAACIAYTGDYQDRDTCPYCGQPRWNAATGKPRRTFCYLSLITQLQGLFKSAEVSRLLRYRATFKSTTPNLIKDVFDGKLYDMLRRRKVAVDGQTLGHKFFSDPRDIALGTCEDGFLIFQRKRSGPSAIPILLQNYNLPPDVRTHAENLICVGVIPGPNHPKELKTFLHPLEDDLAKLAVGVKTYDAAEKEMFSLHAYQLLVGGDIIAIERGLGSWEQMGRSTTYRFIFQLTASLSKRTRSRKGVGSENLPKRTHENWVSTLNKMDAAGAGERERLGKKNGLRERPIFQRVNSLDYARSYPWDWMHLLLENIIPNQIDLWMGRFKGLDEGGECYEIPDHIWSQIAKETEDATKTIPASFVRVLKNIQAHRTHFTAEAYCFWFCYLFPILLRGRFRNTKYYKHGCLLVKIMKRCLQFAITKDELDELERDIIQWVKLYEKYYYQYKEERLSVCVLTIHGLLHIVDDIRNCGPSWTTWTFWMERFCGSLKRALSSKSRPWANLANHCLLRCWQQQLQVRYDVQDELEDAERDYRRMPVDVLNANETLYEGYDECIVSTPCREGYAFSHSDKARVADYFRAALKGRSTVSAIKRALPSTYCLWGKVRLGRSAYIHAKWAVNDLDERRDSTFVRYELPLILNNQAVNTVWYGQVLSILAVDLPDNAAALHEHAGTTHLLALVQPCRTPNNADARNEVVAYKDTLEPVIIDVTHITALVGRVESRGQWHLVDRFNDCALAAFDGQEAREGGDDDDEQEDWYIFEHD